VLISLCYLVVRRVLQLAVLRCQTDALNELEIIVLRHELAILRRRTGRPAVTESDRLFLAAASRLLPRARWPSFIITPTTLLRWHRQRWRGAGRSRIAPVDRRSVARSARLSCG
jgi:putative transposase